MTELRDKRIRFSIGISKLVIWGNSHEHWQVVLGQDFDEDDPKEQRRHRKGSLHYLGLANDLALYVDGIYQEKTEAYNELSKEWKTYDPEFCWGGDFKSFKDTPHLEKTFELTWQNCLDKYNAKRIDSEGYIII